MKHRVWRAAPGVDRRCIWVQAARPTPSSCWAGAGAFGAAAGAVTLHLLASHALPPTTGDLAVLLIPAALATLALAFGTGLWLGRRRLAATKPPSSPTASRASPWSGTRCSTPRNGPGRRSAASPCCWTAPRPAPRCSTKRHHLLAWSRGFAALAEVPEAALHAGLPLADLVRLQPSSPTRKLSRHGIESGVAGAARRKHGDGSHVEDRWAPGAAGGMLLTCRPAAPPRQAVPFSARRPGGPAARRRCAPAATAAGGVSPPATPPPPGWRRMRSAGSCQLRLQDLAEALLVVEIAARAGDLATLGWHASPGLPQRAAAGWTACRASRPDPPVTRAALLDGSIQPCAPKGNSARLPGALPTGRSLPQTACTSGTIHPHYLLG